jgi:glycerol-3-phosphate dehydrogenase
MLVVYPRIQETVMNTGLDQRDRNRAFQQLESSTFDLLIVGAGITGVGIARDAAMRGMNVALVDAQDMGSGTSSRSSKLIHGGMRYLAAGQLHVVKEAATERKTLRRIAPHLAQTTCMLVPIASKAGYLKFKAAMVTYEKLGEVAASERHEIWDLDTIREREPELITDGITSAVAYPEYVTDDARLTLANARSAAGYGATVVTYASVSEILVENEKACGAVVQGTLHGEDRTARIHAKVVINAAGPWLDAVRKLEEAQAPPRLQLTKGIHVTLSRERLPINQTVIMQTPDKRSIFVVPRGRFAYFGTTDTFYPESEYWPTITREDVDYLLSCGNKTFRSGPFENADIVSMWSGVRPLLAEAGKSPSEISRKNETLHGPHGVLSIAGGKLTSYRSMAERIVDECEGLLDIPHQRSQTAEEALPGGDFDGAPAGIMSKIQSQGMSPDEAERAARLYGSEAPDIFAQGYGAEVEAAYAVTHEGALTLEDYWARRSSRAHFDHDGGMASLAPAAETMASLLGWAPEETQRQIDHCKQIRAAEMVPVQE